MATAQDHYSFMLVNNAGDSALSVAMGDSQEDDFRYCDWDLDGHGNIRTVTGQDAMVQATLKCVFTEKQASGYGSSINAMIGEKDIVVKRTSLLMDISLGLMAYKSFVDAQAVVQNLSDNDLIATITQFTVTEYQDNPSKSIVSLTMQSNSGEQTTVGIL